MCMFCGTAHRGSHAEGCPGDPGQQVRIVFSASHPHPHIEGTFAFDVGGEIVYTVEAWRCSNMFGEQVWESACLNEGRRVVVNSHLAFLCRECYEALPAQWRPAPYPN